MLFFVLFLGEGLLRLIALLRGPKYGMPLASPSLTNPASALPESSSSGLGLVSRHSTAQKSSDHFMSCFVLPSPLSRVYSVKIHTHGPLYTARASTNLPFRQAPRRRASRSGFPSWHGTPCDHRMATPPGALFRRKKHEELIRCCWFRLEHFAAVKGQMSANSWPTSLPVCV